MLAANYRSDSKFMVFSICSHLKLYAHEFGDLLRRLIASESQLDRQLQATCLEERVLLSASPLVVLADSVAAIQDATAETTNVEQSNDLVSDGSRVLVFVDSSVAELTDYVDLEAYRNRGLQVETIEIASSEDGLTRISEVLSSRSDVESIHLISHGNEGSVRLGSSTLNLRTLEEQQSRIASWSTSLTQDADILIYGCNVAGSEEGKLLAKRFAQTTDADVAASENTTGHSNLGGDWTLEYATGTIESPIALESKSLSGWNQQLMLHQISGTVFEDLNGDSNVASDPGIGGATVFLFNDNGNGTIDAGDTQIASTTTGADGRYEFDVSAGNYFVAIASTTLTPNAGFNTGFGVTDVWAVQTYGIETALVADGSGGTTTRISSGAYGGRQAGVSDGGQSGVLTDSQHVVAVAVASDITNIDFGFSFNVVTNLLGDDAADDDDNFNNRTIQGTLRQFIQNSNAIAGDNTMRFVPVVDPNQGTGNSQYWEQNIISLLPILTDSGTTIDGQAYDFSDGQLERNSNQTIFASGITVGLGADARLGTGDEFTFAGIDGPELALDTTASDTDYGIRIEGDRATLRNLAIRSFGDTGGGGNGQIFIEDANEYRIERVLVGVAPNAPNLDAVSGGGNSQGAFILNSDNGSVHDSVFAGNARSGIRFHNSDNANVERNVFIRNALVHHFEDGVNFGEGSKDNLFQFNYVQSNQGGGVDTYRGGGGNLFAENTIDGNKGSGLFFEGAGIRLFGDNNEVVRNRISNNHYDGVLVIGDTGDSSTPSIQNRISKNSFEGNQRSIDLANGSVFTLNRGDGVDGIDGTNTGRGNQGLDRPDVVNAEWLGNDFSINLNGTGTVNHLIEVYLAADSASEPLDSTDSRGEGGSYVATFEHNGSGYEVTELAQQPAVGQFLTAIAIDTNGNTSEFSNNFQLQGNASASISVDNANINLLENSSTSAGIRLAEIVIRDDGVGINNLSLSGDDASFFHLSGQEVFLNAGVGLDFESKDIYRFTVQLDDPGIPGSVEDTIDFTLTLTDANEAPSISLSTSVSELFENGESTSSQLIANIIIDDDAIGTNELSLAGADAASFEIVGSSLHLRSDVALDFEVKSSYSVVVQVDDSSVGASPDDSAAHVLNIIDVNEAPSLQLSNAVIELSELADTTTDIKIADISIIDDALGTNAMSLSGKDAALFDIDGTELILRSGALLDFETSSSLEVVIEVDDPVIGISSDDQLTHAITILDGNDAPRLRADAPSRIFFNEDESLAANAADWFEDDESVATELSYAVVSSNNSSVTADFLTDGHSLSFSANPDYFGSAEFVLRATDPLGAFVDMNLSVQVVPVNDTTHPNNQEFSGFGSEVISGNLLSVSQDADGEDLSVRILRQPGAGSLSVQDDGSFTYQGEGFVGFTSFEYVIDDGVAQSSSAVVSIDIEAVLLPESQASSSSTLPSSIEGESTESGGERVDDLESDIGNAAVVQPEQIGPNPQTPKFDDGMIGGIPGVNGNGVQLERSIESGGENVQSTRSQGQASLPRNSGFRYFSYTSNSPDRPLGDTGKQVVSNQLLDFGTQSVAGFDTGSAYFNELDAFKQEHTDASYTQLLGGQVVTATSSIFVGYIFWAVRSGMLMSVSAL
ncbi:MAG: DUF4347 domain-containing protein [Planctomycetota bacterium]